MSSTVGMSSVTVQITPYTYVTVSDNEENCFDEVRYRVDVYSTPRYKMPGYSRGFDKPGDVFDDLIATESFRSLQEALKGFNRLTRIHVKGRM